MEQNLFILQKKVLQQHLMLETVFFYTQNGNSGPNKTNGLLGIMWRPPVGVFCMLPEKEGISF